MSRGGPEGTVGMVPDAQWVLRKCPQNLSLGAPWTARSEGLLEDQHSFSPDLWEVWMGGDLPLTFSEQGPGCV